MHCHICSKVCHEFKDNNTQILYYHCIGCEYIFKAAHYYQDLNTQKERYNLHLNHENDIGYIAYFQRFLDFILPYVSSAQSALDFGCGKTSVLASLIQDTGITCDYYDPIYHPKTLNDSERYDLIVSTEVFEHLHHPKEVFKKLLHQLNPGGYLAIQTEFHSNDTTSFKQWWYPRDTTHIVFFRSQTFKILSQICEANYITDNGKNIVIIQKP